MSKKDRVQDFIPIKDIVNGVVRTTDGRYIKILEIEPINFMLRSEEEQCGIIASFAGWLKISPLRLQFKSITKKADSAKYIAALKKELDAEPNEACRELGSDYIRLISEVGNREALTRRFFLIFTYESAGGIAEDSGRIYGELMAAEQNARAYLALCGNSVVQPKDEDEAAAEILYTFFNRSSSAEETFTAHVERIVVETMLRQERTIGIDPTPYIPLADFISPKSIDLSRSNCIVMDGTYYTYLYIRGNGYPSRIRGGWLSSIVNAGEGIDVDVFLSRESRSRAVDKVAQRIRLNKTKLKDKQDTSTDFEELANSVQSGYYIKQGLANGDDLFYLSVFITVCKSDFLLVADSGPGAATDKGLIAPKFGNHPENHVAVSMTFDALSELMLVTKFHYQAWLVAQYVGAANSVEVGQDKLTEEAEEGCLCPFPQ